MNGLIKTKLQIDLECLLNWFETLKIREEPARKDTTIDYAKDYFEEGSRGYGWALHVFEEPKGTKRILWRHPSRKDDPMIRSKGYIFFEDERKSVIGNEHFTKRREICDGYMGEVLDMFPEGYRGAVWAMHPGFKFVEHIDYPQEQTYRFHVVLQTNPNAMFKIGENAIHMPADGHVWMAATGSAIHTAWNYGEEDRVHIHWQMPIDTWDSYLRKFT